MSSCLSAKGIILGFVLLRLQEAFPEHLSKQKLEIACEAVCVVIELQKRATHAAVLNLR